MPVPSTSGSFGDLLDPRFQRIFDAELEQLPDMLPTLYNFAPDNGRDSMKWSDVGAFGDFPEFSGSVVYDDVAQGFDVTATHLQFASGFQVDRPLFDDDQYNIMDEKPAGLAEAAVRTRQKHGAEVFNSAFSASSSFYAHTENVALCSNSHTTNADSVSTSTGFDNLVTSALSATAVTAAKIQMWGFRDDRAGKISVSPDELWYPNDLYDIAEEIVGSNKKPDTADNNSNVHEGQYTLRRWEYMTDTNNWFLADSRKRRRMLNWVDRVGLEFAFAEDLDTMVAKWRAYMRYSWAWRKWHFILGAQVS